MNKKHVLRIGLGKPSPPNGGIVRCKKVNVRERILQWLFGEKKRLTILVPGDSVEMLSITELEKGENIHGENEIFANGN
jgi:hypothetical protein